DQCGQSPSLERRRALIRVRISVRHRAPPRQCCCRLKDARFAVLASSATRSQSCRTAAASTARIEMEEPVKKDEISSGTSTVQRTTTAARRGARLTVDEMGMLPFARYIESPNCDERPDQSLITMAVIHGISLPPGEFGGAGIIDLFTNRIDPNAHPYYASIASLRV